MEFAINFLKSNVGIDSPTLLASPFLLVAISYFGHSRQYRISSEESKQLRYWVLVANAKGRFSRGASETLLDQDIATIRDGGSVKELIDRLRTQVGVLEITSDELIGKRQRSALFKTMFLAFRSAGAKDWQSNLSISLDHSGTQHRLQFHHIFPKALLSKNGYLQREADDIANFAFIGGKTNRVISDKPPSEYLVQYVSKLGTELFDLQEIPVEPHSLNTDSYKQFLNARRMRIASRLNKFIREEG